MLLVEKSLSQLLRIAFPYTYSEPLLLVQVSCALWKLLGLEQGAEAPAECWELWDTAEHPSSYWKGAQAAGSGEWFMKGKWFGPIPCDAGHESLSSLRELLSLARMQLLGNTITWVTHGRNLISNLSFHVKGVLCVTLDLYIRLALCFIRLLNIGGHLFLYSLPKLQRVYSISLKNNAIAQ